METPISGAYHAYETTELATFKNNLWRKVSAIASGDGGLAKAVAVAEQKEWFGAEVLQGKRAALSEFVVLRKAGEEAHREQRGGFEFVARASQASDVPAGSILQSAESAIGFSRRLQRREFSGLRVM
jgi:hypothetical protein